MPDELAFVQAEHPWFLPTVIGVLGAIVGSFLNVCIYRIPLGRSIITPGSHCACGRPIAWQDNVPVLSWLLLRGRARCCGRPFSVRYPAVELLTAVLFVGCWLSLPPDRALCALVFVSLLVCASFIDLDHMIIPDRFSVGGMLVGLVLSVAVPGLHLDGLGEAWLGDHLQSGLDGLIGALIGSAVVLWILILAELALRREAMGFGDVKLLGAIGAFCGWEGALFAIFGGAVLGSIVFLLAGLLQPLRRLLRSETSARSDGQLLLTGPDGRPVDPVEAAPAFGRETPFGPMLAAAAVLYLLLLQPAVDAYLHSIAQAFGG